MKILGLKSLTLADTSALAELSPRLRRSVLAIARSAYTAGFRESSGFQPGVEERAIEYADNWLAHEVEPLIKFGVNDA